jgi:hypothetical protein
MFAAIILPVKSRAILANNQPHNPATTAAARSDNRSRGVSDGDGTTPVRQSHVGRPQVDRESELACLDWGRSAIRQIESGTALSRNAAAAETVIVYRRRHRARWSKCSQPEPPSRYSVSEICRQARDGGEMKFEGFRAALAFVPPSRMSPPPRSLAADAHCRLTPDHLSQAPSSVTRDVKSKRLTPCA